MILVQRRRRWANVKTTLGQCIMFTVLLGTTFHFRLPIIYIGYGYKFTSHRAYIDYYYRKKWLKTQQIK